MADRLPDIVIDSLAHYVDRRDLEEMLIVTGFPGRLYPALLGAGATTLGRRVFFRKGRYNTQSPKGLALIAHESMHVGQYRELGIVRFLWRYLVGQFKSGFKRDEHPMERELVLRQKEIQRALSL